TLGDVGASGGPQPSTDAVAVRPTLRFASSRKESHDKAAGNQIRLASKLIRSADAPTCPSDASPPFSEVARLAKTTKVVIVDPNTARALTGRSVQSKRSPRDSTDQTT